MSRALAFFAVAVAVAVAACGSPRSGELPTRPLPAPPVAASAAPAVDPTQPTLRLPRNFVPTGYRARLAIDPSKPQFVGAIEIAGTLTERSKRLWLHGRRLDVTAAKAIQAGQTIAIDVT